MSVGNRKEKQIHRRPLRRSCPLCDGFQINTYRELLREYSGTNYRLHLGRCSQCGFVFLLNDPQISYDGDYLRLEGVLSGESVLARFRARERIANISRFVAPAPERCFLDIGIGDGLLLSLVEASGYSAFGLDVNPSAAELARRQYGLQGEVQVGPLTQAFPGRRFDVIHMNEVIEHVAEPMTLLRWCRERVGDAGWLIIQTGNLNSLASRIKGANWDYFRPVHLSYFSTRTLSYAVERAGFRIARRATVDWRLKTTLRMAKYLVRQSGAIRALEFLGLYITALPHGIRRSVVIYAS